jgi:hypothetical protein
MFHHHDAVFAGWSWSFVGHGMVQVLFVSPNGSLRATIHVRNAIAKDTYVQMELWSFVEAA